MKGHLSALLLTLLAIVFVTLSANTACTEKVQSDPLFFKEGSFYAAVNGTFNGQAVSFSLWHGVGGDLTLTYTAPRACQGVRYRQTADGEITASLGEREIPLSELPTAVKGVFQLFFLQQGELVSCSVQKGADTVAVFSCEAGEVTLYLDAADGLPARVEGMLYGVKLSLSFTERGRGEGN